MPDHGVSVGRTPGLTRYRVSVRRAFETSLLALGVVGLIVAGLWQLELVPGSRIELPAPVAFGGLPGVRAVGVSMRATTVPALGRPATQATLPQGQPASQPPAASGALVPASLPGVAQRLVIASIGLDTPVVEGGVRTTADGAPVWETVPNIAVHYATLTALVGARGNAVIAGHVSTRAEGNVFLDLYRVGLGDAIRVWDAAGAEHVFTVVGVQLVPPSDTSVMNATAEPTLTLMTCGGTFDPVRREFSDRLVVTARLSV